jgi:electron transfer flavoprotein alpha subunit
MGGAAVEVVHLDGAPVLLTMAGHAVDPVPAPVPGRVEVRPFAPELSDDDLLGRVRSVEPVDSGGADLGKARVVVGAGRGVGGADRFDDVLELAGALGGTLGVSRVVTSLGWRPHHEQVGQTGSRISPELYIACGISGAIQHWAGCSSAKTILAINTDAEAPMVTRAHYAVIGDLHEVVPAITEELRRRAG